MQSSPFQYHIDNGSIISGSYYYDFSKKCALMIAKIPQRITWYHANLATQKEILQNYYSNIMMVKSLGLIK